MRTWTYTEPGDDDEPVVVVKTDAEILVEYYSYWLGVMTRLGRQDKISEENCIMDWVVVNMAQEVKQP